MINAISSAQLATLLNGELRGLGDLQIASLSKDTRTLQVGDLYVALKGDNFDGHAFLKQAQAQGASCALVEEWDDRCTLTQIKVKNTLTALGQWAGFNRDAFVGPIVAVTGSAGKTSVKQLMHSVLSEKFNTLMTQGNLNNHIGAPLTLLSLGGEHQAAVIELGASGLGEIAYTAKWVKPNVGIITNAALAHIDGFGSLQGVVQTKGELLDYIADKGTAIINADDPFAATWSARAANHKVLFFGLHEQADVRASQLQLSLQGSRFLLHYQNQTQPVNLPLLGEHNVRNALAVTAAALALGMNLSQIISGLEKASSVQGRLQWSQGKNGQRILDDAYNANPASMRAAIDVLQHAPRSILVLGDMAELGDNREKLHAEIGHYAKQQNITHLYATGPLSLHAVTAFGEGAQWFATQPELIQFLKQQSTSEDVLLIKGSRSAAMDNVVRELQKQNGE